MKSRAIIRWSCLILYAAALWTAGVGHDIGRPAPRAESPADDAAPDRHDDGSHDSRHCLVCHYLAQQHATLFPAPPPHAAPSMAGPLAPRLPRLISGLAYRPHARSPPSIG